MTSAKLSKENNLIKYTEEHVIIQTTCSLVFPSSTNREIRHLHVCSRATTAKKCAKTRGARAKLLFAKKTYCFFAVLVAVAVVDA